jgi:phosphoribosyl 1,2-cyclic phosphate phosphodiesterase
MDSLSLTFLGTGTSHGIPMIGCSCSVCTSSDPRDQRTRTSILLGTPEHQILIDTTPDLRTQCLREKITQIDAILLTHSHTDHIMGFDDARRFCEMQDIAMPIYASPFTMGKLREAFRFAFDDPKPWKNYLRLEPHLIEKNFFLGELEMIPVPLPHGSMTTLGFVVKHQGRKLLAYFTDCQEVPEAAIKEAAGAKVLVLDALREKPHPTHLNFEGALKAAQRIGAEQTYFIHFCHDVAHASKEAELPATIKLAYDGLKVKIVFST